MTLQGRALRAFTLIELLIVVAIIAILAAIAVPNFLEAQTRAKVARVQTDMRTLAVGIEAYTVDYNKPPSSMAPNMPGAALNNVLNQSTSVFGVSGSANGYVSTRFIWLTTPVAYMTSVPRDGFINANLGYARTLDSGGAVVAAPEYDTYDYINALTFTSPSADRRWTADSAPGRASGLSSGATWHIVSAGPDLLNCFGGRQVGQAQNSCGMDYDATNGTTSAGDIVRIGGGPGPLGAVLPKFDRITGKIN